MEFIWISDNVVFIIREFFFHKYLHHSIQHSWWQMLYLFHPVELASWWVIRGSNNNWKIGACNLPKKTSIMQIKFRSRSHFLHKDGLARSPDMVSRQKNRIFYLHWIREVESKKFLTKSWRTNQNQKIFKAKFFHLMILSNFMKAVKYGNRTQCWKDYWNIFS